MRLIFIRHAESTANLEGRLQGHADYRLSDLGRQQAECLYRFFQDSDMRPTHIYSSPLTRALETAEIASRLWGFKIKAWSELIEYDVGVFSGLTWDEISCRHAETAHQFRKNRDWDTVEQAEKVVHRNSRGERIIAELITAHDNHDTLMCFTHGGILQHIIRAVLSTDRTWGIPVKNTAIFEFHLDKERWDLHDETSGNTNFWKITRFNDADHLRTYSGKQLSSAVANDI